MAFILVFGAVHYRSSGRLTKVLEQAEKCIVLCDEHGMSHERESVGVAYGWAMARRGESKKVLRRSARASPPTMRADL